MKIFDEEVNGKITGRKYIVINDEKYYFDQKYVSNNYTTLDAEIDAFRKKLAEAANIELSMDSYKSFDGKYITMGMLPNGNMIVYNSKREYGVVDINGNIVVPFKYNKIQSLRDSNGKIVHQDFFIAESKKGYVPSYGYMRDRFSHYRGIVTAGGIELFSIDDMKLDSIDYESSKDLIHCNKYENWRGLANGKGYSGFDEDTITISGEQLYSLLEEKQNSKNDKNMNEQENTKQVLENLKKSIDKELASLEESNNKQINSNLENQQITKEEQQFLIKFNNFIKEYNNYKNQVEQSVMHIDTNKSSQLLEMNEYLKDQLNLIKEVIGNEKYIKYGVTLDELYDRLKQHTNSLNEASSIFHK